MGFAILEPRAQYDSCVVGMAERGTERVLLYSRKRIIESLVKDGLTEEEAYEHFGFNMTWPQIEGWPVFLCDDEDFDLQVEIENANGLES